MPMKYRTWRKMIFWEMACNINKPKNVPTEKVSKAVSVMDPAVLIIDDRQERLYQKMDKLIKGNSKQHLSPMTSLNNTQDQLKMFLTDYRLFDRI